MSNAKVITKREAHKIISCVVDELEYKYNCSVTQITPFFEGAEKYYALTIIPNVDRPDILLFSKILDVNFKTKELKGLVHFINIDCISHKYQIYEEPSFIYN